MTALAPHSAEPTSFSTRPERTPFGIRIPDFPPTKILPYRRGIIVALHLLLIPIGYGAAFFLRFEWPIPPDYVDLFWSTLPLLIILRLGSFAAFRMFNGWWRYAGMFDLMAVLKAATASSGLFVAVLFVTRNIAGFPRSIIFLDWGIAILLFGGIRFAVRWVREGRADGSLRGRKRALIIGAGDAAAQLLNMLRVDPNSGIEPIGLVDDDTNKRWIHVHGVPVLGATRDLHQLIPKHRIDLVIVAIAMATDEEMRKIVEQCAGLSVEFKVLPSLRELIERRASPAELKTVQVEDLLGRPCVKLDLERVRQDLQGRVVMITGAAGSIGSELARQVAGFQPARLLLVEQSESPLFFIDFELSGTHPGLDVIPLVADIRDARRLEGIFQYYRPDYVFHAAAYKHVPLMEANVFEAARNNVVATFDLARCAAEYGVEKFVLISTDKAVRPSSVMGASKRIAERIVLEWPDFRSSITDFRAVRFGNVLGSAGSVIPLFKRQIAKGGPVTVTHPEMKRYFMTIPEAVELVLQAAALPEAAGRISMLDMGEPVSILAMAENLIRLSGLEPYTEIPIVITGIRPGEKIVEELMLDIEQTIGTHVEKVRIVQGTETDGVDIQVGLIGLTDALAASDPDGLMHVLCGLVPECMAPLCEKGAVASAKLEERRALIEDKATRDSGVVSKSAVRRIAVPSVATYHLP